ncbi:flagellar filament capping protein FliD [Brevibacillus ginsengisoli]|uniref:flagellar filament capping protein FliD n=1 Tax=Brevibacillus ginsengisoli TaxID=363854 RepID=UPI003CEB080D
MTSINRLPGLVSGLDTDTMVKNLMKAQRVPLDKLKQQKQTETWKRDAYREMNTLLLDFRDNTMSNLKLQGTFNPKKVNTTNDNNVGATITGNPTFSSYVLENVTQATPAVGASVTFKNNIADGSTKLSSAGGSSFSFSIKAADGTARSLTVNASDTITDVIANINSLTNDSDSGSGTKVKATYDSNTKSIVFLSTTTGSSAGIKISGVLAPNILNIANGTVDKTTADFNTDIDASNNTSCSQGTDINPGSVKVNGTVLSLTGNTFTFDGVKFSLKQNFVSPTTVNVTTDNDAVFDKIKNFVDKYNDLIDKVNKKTSEPIYRDFPPLTDDQRANLSEKQIDQWEDKAKSGTLRRDSMLSTVLINMRKSIASSVTSISDPKCNSLSEIGITTAQASKTGASYNYMENGKLYIDEAKLKDAISQNPDKVMAIFTNKSTSTDSTTKFNENGIAQRMYNTLASSIGKIIDIAGTSISPDDSENYEMGKAVRSMNKQISSWESRLQDTEDRYYKQFSAMETALSKMNSQSSWLAQQLGQK